MRIFEWTIAAGLLAAGLAGTAQAESALSLGGVGRRRNRNGARGDRRRSAPSRFSMDVAFAMATRADPATQFQNVKPATFGVTGCEALFRVARKPPQSKVMAVALPRPDPRRIVVFGDTGCRIAKRDRVQACNDPKSWPFPEVARRAAAAHPDLVIHVGDYLYREEPCPTGQCRMRRHSVWLRLGYLGCRFFQTGRTITAQRALDFRTRQP